MIQIKSSIFKIKHVLFFIVPLLLTNCKNEQTSNDILIARFEKENLYVSDIAHLIPKELKNSDSIAFVQTYAKKWIMDKLLLEKASLNVSDDLEEIEEKVEAYRQSLLTFKYEQRFLAQKVNRTVTDEEIQTFYNEHKTEFILNEHIVKAYFVVYPTKLGDASKLAKLINSNKESDYDEFKDFCFKYAKSFQVPEKWLSAGSILNEMPQKDFNAESVLRSRQIITQSDTVNTYIFKAFETISAGENAPKDYVYNSIKQIIIQKRTQDLQKNFRNKLFDDALKKNLIEIYTK